MKVLQVHKMDIFHKSDVLGTSMGPIHALALQLLAKKTSNCTKVGTEDLNEKHILVSLTANFCEAENWEGIIDI